MNSNNARHLRLFHSLVEYRKSNEVLDESKVAKALQNTVLTGTLRVCLTMILNHVEEKVEGRQS